MTARQPLPAAVKAAVAALFAIPLIGMAVVAFTVRGDDGVTWTGVANFPDAWNSTNFPRQFLNSAVVCVLVVAGQVMTSATAGFALARYDFVGKRWFYAACVASVVVPFQVLVVPLFVVLVALGWIDTYQGLVAPSVANGFGILLFATHYASLPRELADAAAVDGAGPFSTFRHVYLPLSGPPAATLAVFTFVAEWNDLFKPLVFTTTRSMRTVQLGLSVFQEQFALDRELLSAAALVVAVPAVVVYWTCQRYLGGEDVTSGSK